MRVYLDVDGDKRLIGRAEIPESVGPTYVVPLFGAASTMMETYVIGAVTSFPPDGGPPVVERAVVLSTGQLPELLPSWMPLNS